MSKRSRNALRGKIVHLRKGLAIYRVVASPYWRVRVWVPSSRKRSVRTTKATNRVEAIRVAEQHFNALGTSGCLSTVPREMTFERFADRLVNAERHAGQLGQMSARAWKNTLNLLRNSSWGILVHVGQQDVRKIGTTEYLAYIENISRDYPSLSVGTLNHIAVVFRKVLLAAHKDGVLPSVPATPRHRRRDNPRPFFRFYPLVPKANDEVALLLRTARIMAREGVTVRGVPITEEIEDFILFMLNSFLRPTIGEVYSLTHGQVSAAHAPARLLLAIPKGKTGSRMVNTLSEALPVYRRIKRRQKVHKSEIRLFFSDYRNRGHAMRVVQNQFNAILARANLKQCRQTGLKHSIYSLRHTAICMRLVLSEGKVNIFSLAKNAGTSVDQIERFYARYLPLQGPLVRNLIGPN